MSDTLLSMTGYGELSRELGERRWRCVVQSVNSRYLDCRVRLPQEYISLEPALRGLLKNKLIRGKVDLVLSYEKLYLDPGDGAGDFDKAAAKQFCRAGLELLRELGWQNGEPVYRQALLSASLQQAMTSRTAEVDESGLPEQIKLLVSEALLLHRQSCLDEGRELSTFFLSAMQDLNGRIDKIHSLALQMPELFKQRLQSRISRLVDNNLELDQARLCQEIAHQVDRSDVSEEIVRFKSHIKQFCSVIESSKELRKGKKLDFIVQELSREINTITAKASFLELTREAVEVKTVLEQVREQVQNVV